MKTFTNPLGEEYDADFFTLSNYKRILTPVAFIDECGNLSDKNDPFFGIGMFKTHRPTAVYPLIRSSRSKLGINQELSFRCLDNLSLPLAKEFIRIAMTGPLSRFRSIILPKTHPKFNIDKHFDGDIFQLYKKFLVGLLRRNIAPNEVLTVIMDEYFSPKYSPYNPAPYDSFEGGVRAIVNDHFKRLAITNVIQMNSKSTDLLQLADLLIGCAMFDLRISSGMIDTKKLSGKQKVKLELLQHLKTLLGINPSELFFSQNGKKRRHFKVSHVFEVYLFNPDKSSRSSFTKTTPATTTSMPKE